MLDHRQIAAAGSSNLKTLFAIHAVIFPAKKFAAPAKSGVSGSISIKDPQRHETNRQTSKKKLSGSELQTIAAFREVLIAMREDIESGNATVDEAEPITII